MARFIGDDVPVIHLVNIRQLAGRYGLPEIVTAIPRVGEGGVYAPTTYNPWLAAAALVAVFVALYLPGTLRRLQTSPAHVAGMTHSDGRRNGKPRPGDRPICPSDRPRHSDHGGDSGRIPNGEVVL